MTDRLIDELQKKAFPVAQSCRVPGVSRSGFYEARLRAETTAICKASMRARTAFAASRQSDGSRHLTAALANQGLQIGRYKVRSRMRRERLKPVWKRKSVHTTDRRHGLPVAPNVLGWLYLAVVLDLFSRKVVGWAMPASANAKWQRKNLSLCLEVLDHYKSRRAS